jgi:hypothetical protein
LRLFTTISFYLISIFIGALFIYSAYAKLIDIEPFEWTIAETGLFSFTIANMLSRAIIIIEFFLGICFVFNVQWGRRIYSLAAIILMVFNCYLLYILFIYGDNGNCGCFGKSLIFTPAQAYWKNLLLILLIFVLSLFKLPTIIKFQPIILLVAAILSIGFTFYKEPLDVFVINLNEKKIQPYAINLDPLYADSISIPPSFDYKKGKYIISVLSLHCHFCKKAARKMHSMMLSNSSLPLYILYGGDKKNLQTFINETLSNNVPHQYSSNETLLIELAGGTFPTILWVENGKVIRNSNYFTLKQKEIENWLK